MTINTTNAEHYVWGEVCDGWRLLAGGDLAVTQERIPPGRGEAEHYHGKARQLFFVLEDRSNQTSMMEAALGRRAAPPSDGLHQMRGRSKNLRASSSELVGSQESRLSTVNVSTA